LLETWRIFAQKMKITNKTIPEILYKAKKINRRNTLKIENLKIREIGTWHVFYD